MGLLYNRYNVPEVSGKDIVIPEHFPAILVSEHDRVFCYTGMFMIADGNRDSPTIPSIVSLTSMTEAPPILMAGRPMR